MSDPNPSVWFNGPGQVEIRQAEVPESRHGEVLIRTSRTLISGGTELSLLTEQARPESAWSEFARFPRAAGYSNAGEVMEAGEDVDGSCVGKHVATRGPHAAWVTRREDDLRAIPDGVSDEEATFATLAGVVMNGLRRARLTWGESVVVFGLGIIGQLSVRVATAAGAGPVFGVDLSESRLNMLPAGPRVRGLTASDHNGLLDAVRQRNHGRPADLVIEATGEADLIPAEIALLRDEGRLLMLSSPRSATRFDFHDLCNRRSITITGAHGFSQPKVETPENPWTSKRHGDLFLEWLATGRLSVRELITHRFPFDRAPEAYQLLLEKRREALGVVFEWA